ncbi:hypothetical protein [Tellurirhabdus rosea]|uniref:hypothetical protein n=1 Tax=Tellurirhabdus rosea TaxID=2674997 RepID=UPI002257B4CD|nr:hypothetical protein [Tellurirhabdus rosea]
MSREHLDTLTEIRSLMERSSKFLSLSGLSGISAGLVALAGAGAAYFRLNNDWLTLAGYDHLAELSADERSDVVSFLMLDAAAVLIGALVLGVFFTVRKARQQGLSVWNATSRRLLWALAVPLVTGGVFCLALIHHNLLWLAFPSTLIFYGLALLNGSKFTIRYVEYLGLSEVALGLLALFATGYTLLTWTIGFGLLHIVYGIFMYYKYDKSPAESVR